jgi:hypothetical protein
MEKRDPNGDGSTKPKERQGRCKIKVWLTAEERARVEANANTMAISKGAWLLQAALAMQLPAPPAPEINIAECSKLAQLSSELYQLPKMANSAESEAVFICLLEQLSREVKRLRRVLHGIGDANDQ